MTKLYTLEEAAKLAFLPTAVTLRKYANRGMIGVKIGPAPEPGHPDRRRWYLTEADVKKVQAMPYEAHKAGRPKKS